MTKNKEFLLKVPSKIYGSDSFKEKNKNIFCFVNDSEYHHRELRAIVMLASSHGIPLQYLRNILKREISGKQVACLIYLQLIFGFFLGHKILFRQHYYACKQNFYNVFWDMSHFFLCHKILFWQH